MEDFLCPFCKEVFKNPVIVDRDNFINTCKSCAEEKLVGKGRVTIPGTSVKVEIETKDELRPNITLHFLLNEILDEGTDILERNEVSLLDSLSLFSLTGYDQVPFDQDTENTVDLVLQAPERFSTSVDLVAVVDFSASMKGSKISLMKETLKYFLSNLDENDRFGVVAFASDVTRVFKINPATPENKSRWIEKLTKTEAKNRSDLCGGLLEGIEMLGKLKGKRTNAAMVVFTDGQATKGVIESDEILHEVKKSLQRHQLRVPMYSFGYRRHQVFLMRKLAEMCNGQYFFIQHPEQIPESLAISFTDIRRSHFHDIQIQVDTLDNVIIKQIGTKVQIAPIPGTSSLKKGCLLLVNQLSERRQKNILFRLALTKIPAPIKQFGLLTAKLSYIDSTLFLKRTAKITVYTDRSLSSKVVKLIENPEITSQWNRMLVGTSIDEAAQLAKSSETIKKGLNLLNRTFDSLSHQPDDESNEIYKGTIKKAKKMLEKAGDQPLDDSHAGKLVDIANAFLHEQSSIYISAYNTEAVDQVLDEIQENTKTFEEIFGEGGGRQRKNRVDVPKSRLNTFKRFRDLKQHELAQLYSKLNIKGKLTSQEIEARLKRAKGKQKSEIDDELMSRFKAQKLRSQQPYVTLRKIKPGKLSAHLIKDTQNDSSSSIFSIQDYTHQALYDFIPTKDSEIRLKQGDPVLIEEVRPNGMCEGENLRSGKYGLFPHSHIAIILSDRTSSVTLPTHIVSKPYVPVKTGEIALSVGDKLIVSKQMSDGMCEGQNINSDKYGIFPKANISPNVTHVATEDFTAYLPMELELQKGDPIVVTKLRTDGWLYGLNARTQEVGLLPKSFTKPYTGLGQ